MRVLTPQGHCDHFFSRLTLAGRRVLLLDYDGTLAPFQIDRLTAIPYPGLTALLVNISKQRNTRMAIVSGRWSQELLPLLGMNPHPEIWGSHGWERLLPDGSLTLAPLDETMDRGLREALDIAAHIGGAERCESKPGCAAFHVRGLPEEEQRMLCMTVQERWEPVAAASGLHLRAFDGGIELTAPGRSKADAVHDILQEEPQDAVIAYLGDDHTDEDAFKALEGRGLRVLVRPEFRTTAADLWLEPPDELSDFLQRWFDCTHNA